MEPQQAVHLHPEPVPLGASRDLAAAAGDISPVITVQAKHGKGGGNKQAGGGGGGNQQVGAGGGGGNRVGGGGNRGGNRVGGGGGNRHSGRTAAGIAVGVGLIGGLIAAEQHRQTVEQEYIEQPRCRYGSYINRYGEQRCRR